MPGFVVTLAKKELKLKEKLKKELKKKRNLRGAILPPSIFDNNPFDKFFGELLDFGKNIENV